MHSRLYLAVLLLFTAVLSIPMACKKENPELPDLEIDLASLPLDKLSDYGFFTGELNELEPYKGVIPYELITPLFSDYAGKSRFVWMPAGKSATYTENGVLDFPVGAIIIKHFYFDNDLRDPSLGRQIMETRLLIRQDTAWQPASYIWNSAQDEADFTVLARQVNVEWTHFDGTQRSTNYYIPNKNDCKGCHNVANELLPIGPKVRNLNSNFAYANGTENQLDRWASEGYLTGLPTLTSVPKVAKWDDSSSGTVTERARAYLDVNCAHCHNADGPANNSGFFLNYGEMDEDKLGFCKTPVAAGQGSGGLDYVIVPGLPDESILPFRMNSTVTDIAMPELARSVIHEEGLQLIRDWITSLPGDCD